MAPPTLWHLSISHYNEKARWALDYKAIPHHRELRFLDYPVRTWLRTGQMKLPVLISDDGPICDSTAIIAHLERTHPHPALYPEDPDLRARALALEDFFDEEVGGHIRALLVDELMRAGKSITVETFAMGVADSQKRLMSAFYGAFRPFYNWRHGIYAESVELARSKVAAGLERLESEMGDDGYLVGGGFSVADLTAASILYPIALPKEYPYQPPAGFRDVMDMLLADFEHAFAADWVKTMYERHRGKSAAIGAELS